MTDDQQIQEEKPDRYYFAIMPNIADEELTTYEYRLYGHYKRRVGENSDKTVYEAIQTTSLCTGMGLPKIRQARAGLRHKGFIWYEDTKHDGKPIVITLLDVWERNMIQMNKPTRKPKEIAALQADSPALDPERRKQYLEKARLRASEDSDHDEGLYHDKGVDLYHDEYPDSDHDQRKEESLQEEQNKKNQDTPPTPFSNVGDSSTYAPDPSQNGKKAPNTKGQIQKKAVAPAAISEVVTESDPLPPELAGYKFTQAFHRSWREGWSWVHVYILIFWLGANHKKAPFQSDINKTMEIYKAFQAKTNLPPTATAIGDFMAWYRKQDWVVDIAAKEHMGVVEQVDLPKSEAKLAPHLDKWLTARQAKPSTSVYVAPEVNPYERQQSGVRAGVGS